MLDERAAEPGVRAVAAEIAAPAPPVERIPPEFNGREYVRFLLYVAATIEHSLMVQYLFAAYSLGGPDVPAERRADVRAWQETILGIAKEEMGHLVTVQNLLTAVGAPLNFDREDYPYDTPFYPFGFRLQPAGLGSLAAYVCAESPEEWDEPDEAEIKALAQEQAGRDVNRVGMLYAQLIDLLGDETVIPDSAFDAPSFEFQASWDEWGRGYREGQRGTEAMSDLGLPAPELLILRVDSRASAIAALEQVGEQGEGLETPPDENESHFRRFLAIYRALEALDEDERAAVVRRVAANPTTDPAEADEDPDDPDSRSSILNPVAKRWAHLFNLRYRKLLIDVTHAFQLADDPSDAATLSPRGALIHRTFAEMYNLRAIAALLVRLPLDAGDPTGARAAPPFQMPYTLKLPAEEADRWQLHRDLLDTAAAVIADLEADSEAGGRDYLAALAQADDLERAQLDLLIAASTPPLVADGGPP
jgi:hypothetical protein